MKNIQIANLVSGVDSGKIAFNVNGVIYKYNKIDLAVMSRIMILEGRKQIGGALNMAKQFGNLYDTIRPSKGGPCAV
jgi:hypothetical protein